MTGSVADFSRSFDFFVGKSGYEILWITIKPYYMSIN